jgi:hypothetical protein
MAESRVGGRIHDVENEHCAFPVHKVRVRLLLKEELHQFGGAAVDSQPH